MLSAEASLGQRLLGPPASFRCHLGAEASQGLLQVQVLVPNVEVPAGGELRHTLADMPRPTVSTDAPTVSCDETAVTSSDREAGREPFNVPFPWSWQRLVEIVHVEDEASAPASRRHRSSTRWASPQHCTVVPVLFVLDKSDAIIRAAPL